MRILVTGSSGFVGKYLIESLEEGGQHEVVGMSRRTHGLDVRNYEDCRKAVERAQPDIVFHLAAQAYVPETTTDPQRGYSVNLGGTLNILEAVRHTGCRARVLVTGTSEEYGYETQVGDLIDEDNPTIPTSLYGASKLAASQLALAYGRTHGIEVVVTRAWNHTGPGQPAMYAIPSFARKVANAELGYTGVISHGNLDAYRCYLDVRDVVSAYVRAAALGRPGQVYNVGVGQVWPMRHYLEQLLELSTIDRSRVELIPDPTLYRPGMTTGGRDFPIPDSRKLAADTGWAPEFTLQDTLSEVLAHWRHRLTFTESE